MAVHFLQILPKVARSEPFPGNAMALGCRYDIPGTKHHSTQRVLQEYRGADYYPEGKSFGTKYFPNNRRSKKGTILP